MTTTPTDQACEVLRYLRSNGSPDLRLLRATCRRIIVAGEHADPADLGVLAVEVERRAYAEQRFTSPGVAMIGDEVIWDGEAEVLGVAPLKRWSDRPRRGTPAWKAKAGPKGRAKGRGRTAPPVARGEPPAR